MLHYTHLTNIIKPITAVKKDQEKAFLLDTVSCEQFMYKKPVLLMWPEISVQPDDQFRDARPIKTNSIIHLFYRHSIFTPFTLDASVRRDSGRPTTQYSSQISFPVVHWTCGLSNMLNIGFRYIFLYDSIQLVSMNTTYQANKQWVETIPQNNHIESNHPMFAANSAKEIAHVILFAREH